MSQAGDVLLSFHSSLINTFAFLHAFSSFLETFGVRLYDFTRIRPVYRSTSLQCFRNASWARPHMNFAIRLSASQTHEAEPDPDLGNFVNFF